MKAPFSRRKFIRGAAVTSATAGLGGLVAGTARAANTAKPATPAAKATRPAWPISDERTEEALIGVLRSGRWGRNAGGRVEAFEALFAEKSRAKYCVATSSGTTALLSSIGALGIGPGDEVILPPYTFVATFNVITANYALPVFADVDAGTFQIDPAKISAAITPATKMLLPVHIGGLTCELSAIAETARSRNIPMLEDACQAPLAEWRGQPVGTQGIGGCFSFQSSKNLTSGEGGAVVTNDEAFANQVYNFHTPGGSKPGPSWGRAANYRLTEFQAAILLAQYTRFEEQQAIRVANARFLTSELQKIPGITPAKLTSGCTKGAWHLYMFRYDTRQFAGLTRAKFVQALAQENVGANTGYSSLNNSAHVKALADNPHYQKIYGKQTMARWVERNQCPVNDKLINEAVWFTQTTLLGTRAQMERIVTTVASIHRRAGELARA